MSLVVLARKTRATIESRNARTNKNGQFSLNGPLPSNRSCGWKCNGASVPRELPAPNNRQISNRSLLQRRVNGLHSSLQPTPKDADPAVYICNQQHTLVGKSNYMSAVNRSYGDYIKGLVSQNSHIDRKNVTDVEWADKLKCVSRAPGEQCKTGSGTMIYKGPFGGFESGEHIRTIKKCIVESGGTSTEGCVVKASVGLGLPGCSC